MLSIFLLIVTTVFTCVIVFWNYQYHRTKKKILSVLRQNPEKWFTAMELSEDYEVGIVFAKHTLGELNDSGLVYRKETDYIYPGTNAHRPAYKIKG